MAPPSRHKRGRSSTSSRASTNVHKTEVTINVYDLLPVSELAGLNSTQQQKCYKLAVWKVSIEKNGRNYQATS